MKNSKKFVLGIEFALIIIFTSAGFLLFLWKSTIGYFLAVILSSLLGGILIIDFDESLKLVSIAFIAGCILFVVLSTLPAFIFGEIYSGEINFIVAQISTNYSRIIIISFPLSVFSCLFGCFLGKSFSA
ncbi:MAG: hypothetical protein ACTSYD_03835 [Candidatus Heimdallarchaeaceae archaeon]